MEPKPSIEVEAEQGGRVRAYETLYPGIVRMMITGDGRASVNLTRAQLHELTEHLLALLAYRT